MDVKSSLKALAALTLIGILSACSLPPPVTPVYSNKTPAPKGPTDCYGNLLPAPNPCAVILNKVQSQGTLVIIKGNEVTMVMPSDRYFSPGSTALRTNSFPLLDNIAATLACYRKVDVSVKAYSDTQGTEKFTKAVTQSQATQIARYLWKAGANARIMQADGEGTGQPFRIIMPTGARAKGVPSWVSAAVDDSQGAGNRRIEITFNHVTYPML